MHPNSRPRAPGRPAGRRRPVSWLLAALAATGCGREAKITFTDVSEPPTVRVVRPPLRDITRVVAQPSFIQAYEHTAIYAKLTSFVEKWVVDIGDRVKKGDVLATLFMPELVQDLETKKADVALDRELIDRASRLDEEARADVEAAEAKVAEARSIIGKFQAEVDRWASEVKRLEVEGSRGVVAPQIVLESTNQLKSSTAAREAAQSSLAAARATLISKQAAAATSQVDVGVARARLVVAQSQQKRVEALVGYLTLTAPFDGVIVVRNANTGDFTMPNSGDPSARSLSPDLSPEKAAAIFVVDRTDVVRIFVDVPEGDADFVQKGTKATVLARAYRDAELPASVTRTSWALNVKSRTLRAEIDLPNTDGRLLPGMYAYGKVIIERPGVRAVPLDALVYSGEQTFLWKLEDGKAVRREIQTGVSDGEWIEVTNRRGPSSSGEAPDKAPWVPIDGSERVILGDLSILTDGGPVKVAEEKKGDEKAGGTASDGPRTSPRPGALARSR